jgi:aryl-alcohol dehydrogenase-like predicted oxidoreductase
LTTTRARDERATSPPSWSTKRGTNICKKRKIGHSHLKIAPLVLGTNTFGWSADPQTSFGILDAFVEPDTMPSIRLIKVRAIGASHYDAGRLADALRISHDNGVCRYDSLQPRYNLCDRAEFETAVQEICVKNDVGVIPYSVLARGF